MRLSFYIYIILALSLVGAAENAQATADKAKPAIDAKKAPEVAGKAGAKSATKSDKVDAAKAEKSKKPESAKAEKPGAAGNDKQPESVKKALPPVKNKPVDPNMWLLPKAELRYWLKAQEGKYFGGTGKVRLPSGWMDESKVKVAVYTDKLVQVGAKVLWQRQGEYLEVVFDASSDAKRYILYMSEQDIGRNIKWEPNSGVVMEVRRGSNRHIYNLKKFDDLWDKAGEVLSRRLVNNVFHGTVPYVPAKNILVKYRGWLDIKKAGEYQIATMSDDSSFVSVEGRMVVAWPGPHSVWGGRYGEHKGKVNLKKGRHLFEYRNAFVSGRFCVSAAWQKPGSKGVLPIAAKDFGKISRFRWTRAQAKDPKKHPMMLLWQRRDSVIVKESTGEGLVEMKFSIYKLNQSKEFQLLQKGAKLQWRFNGGFERVGNTAEVVLPVMPTGVEVSIGNWVKAEYVFKRRIEVIADWTRWDRWEGKRYWALVRKMRSKDFTGLDLAGVIRMGAIAVAVNNRTLLLRAGGALLKADLTADLDLNDYARIADKIAQPPLKRYAMAEKLYTRALSVPALAKAEGLQSVALGYVRLLVDVYGRSDKASEIALKYNLESGEGLDKEQRAQVTLALAGADMLRGDAAAAYKRMVKGAKKLKPDKQKKLASRRRAKVQACEVWLAKGDFPAVVDAVTQLREDNITEMFNPASALLMIKSYYGRQEYERAYYECLKVLALELPPTARSDILFQGMLCATRLGYKDEAKKYKDELISKYPQTYAGARAAEYNIDK